MKMENTMLTTANIANNPELFLEECKYFVKEKNGEIFHSIDARDFF